MSGLAGASSSRRKPRPVTSMNTSSKVGLPTDTESTNPGSDSMRAGTNSWPRALDP